MEAKKSPGKELARMTPLFRSLGFLLSLSLIAMAFEWKSHQEPLIDLRGAERIDVTEIVEVPVTASPVPRPALRPLVLIEQKEDEPEPIAPPVFDQEESPAAIPSPLIAEPPKEDSDIEFIFVEESASPVGGFGAFYTHIKDQLKGKYPAVARRMGIEGRVFLEFVVEKDGTLTGIHVVKGIGGGCDELAQQVLAASPKWKPGKQRGKPVRQRLTLPVYFKLG